MVEIVVVTASAGTFPGLKDALGAIPVAVEEHPLMDFTGPAEWAPVDAALARLTAYGTVAITSPRAARAIAERIELKGIAWPQEETLPAVWAGGPATAAALRGALGSVRTPSEGDAARWGAAGALARTMIDAGVTGPVLFPCGKSRRDELPERLRNSGIQVEEVVCYRSVLADRSAARNAARRGTVLVVASPSVADLVARACPPESRPDLLAVGPTTAAAARASGWMPAAVALLPTVAALAAAVRDVIASRCPHE